ncbi:hypothetical protein F5B22DRAFT_637265 [Xylaria bambusicola]|uniref:uncharacterized protein n=1 Tax=Xylaria bambusicola TaxID=326684 RepID=UPI00200778A9|nr:uncharacterized protein F5B22DRAFT_637265 [Xylaria bambusicola]KAI0513094.1 hypothetical protein F5B22DRAFT_637265 [Xylaria bambusicola]
MSIPNSHRNVEDDAPPPLPPPRFIPGFAPPGPPSHDRIPSIDSTASWDSRRDSDSDHLRFRKKEVRPHQRDEGYHSMNSTFSSIGTQDSFPKKLFMSHNIPQFNKSAASDYDSHLLKKLDSRRVFDNRSPPRRSGLAMSLDQSRPDPSRHNSIPQLSLPLRLNNNHPTDSSSRFTESPTQSVATTTSPRAAPYYSVAGPEYRSPVELTDMDRSPRYRARRNNSDDATMSTHSGYDNMEDVDFPMEETSGIRRLRIDEAHGRSDYRSVGQKRRASSPPSGDSPPQGPLNSSDPTRRRDGVGRGSPAPRLSLVPPSSMSSVSTAGRSASYVSTASLNTSISSLTSFGGRSPSGLSSGGLSPVDMMGNSPYNTPVSLGPSCAPFGRAPHQRNASNENKQLASPRKVVEVPKATISKLQGGFLMCECCPKKPKKFETPEELSAHEAEKQYECSFCGNRFKNKNEAERHQNSLHVRRHSWSCSALLMSGFDRAFHESQNRPGEADTCGYCGEEFMRSGGAARARHATERDWDMRLKHLQEAHKFRECNSSKKFYRADHFRQHLKHSHAGTSGKWTNMLENACMLDEEPPQPSR